MTTEISRSVGRPREFDEDIVLGAAMDAFWRKGYEATSLSELCSCTGLHKGSLYQAFGDKHELFMRALQHYADMEFNEVMKVASQADTPLGAVRAAVDKISCDSGSEKGCLVINSIVELAPHDDDVKKALQGFGSKRIAAMADMLAKAQEAGEIRAELEPDKLATQLMVTLAGAAAMVKGILDGAELRKVLSEMIDSWT